MPPKTSKRTDLPGADLLFGSPTTAATPPEASPAPPEPNRTGLHVEPLTRMEASPETLMQAAPDTRMSVNTEAGVPVNTHANDEPEAEAGEEAAPGPVKFTFYFSPSTLEDLEDTWIKLRSARKRKGRRPISKSEIVNAAVKAALEDPESLLKMLGP